MKIRRKDKEKGSEKRDLTKKVGIASSSIVGSGIGALSGYGLSRIGEEKRKKKIATKIEQKRLEDVEKIAAKLNNPEQVEALKRGIKLQAREQADKLKTTPKRKLGFIVPGAIIGATAGGIAYDKITKKKRRSRDNENTETK
jgi:hypothetical protein